MRKPITINGAEISEECLKVIFEWQQFEGDDNVIQTYIDDLGFSQDVLTRMLLDTSSDMFPEFKFNELIITLMNIKADLMKFRKGGKDEKDEQA